MSIPGLGQITPQAAAATTVRTITLQQLWEWRFEVPRRSSGITVRLVTGTAERDGTPLALNRTYTFVRTKSKLLTWHGCTIEVNGDCDAYVAEYVAPEDSPSVSYLNLHFALKERRDHVLRMAGKRGVCGPRVMICGPKNSGKTSLARTLVAYATKMGAQPLVATVDPGEGLLSLPGTMSAAVFGTVMDVEDPAGGFGVRCTPSTGPSAVPVKLPIVYYFGREKVEDDGPFWRELVGKLAGSARVKVDEVDEVRCTGLVLDTPAVAANQGGIDILVHAASEFAVNVVVVLGSAGMNAELQRRLAHEKTRYGEPITVLLLDKSEGVAERDKAWMRGVGEEAIKEYFFGDSKRTLSPFTHSVTYEELTILKVPDESEYFEGQQVLIPAEISPEMSNWTLAVMDASVNDPPEVIRQAAILGFIAIADVDEERRRVKFLSPVSGRLGNRPLVWGRWPEPYINLVG
ncbi:Pre-mRNA cleavage complex II protein Clp1-domain-containing protein [Cercophora scortea]|uniref:Polynucleotide 5'-hydroxyl-kinase GRC3 n=1 Tax=Cercophora scortea TaxID=314031 RepID=A0AAE0IF71_9PEZI|nr:Pre-mRNA cleavage complex II protein Clp1-domain-containing protein [Cercophora scortea]